MTNLTKRTDRFTQAEIDDEIVVMLLDTGEFYSLTGTASAIWRLIDGTHDQAAMIDALLADFDGCETDISVEVDQFITKLKELGLVADY